MGQELTARSAGLRSLIYVLDLGELAERAGIDLCVAGGVYFEIERRFSIDVLRERIGQGEADFWQERARTNLEDELASLGAALTSAALASEADPERLKAMVPKTVAERWARSHGAAIERYDRLMDELKALEAPPGPPDAHGGPGRPTRAGAVPERVARRGAVTPTLTLPRYALIPAYADRVPGGVVFQQAAARSRAGGVPARARHSM